jgi:hypothetical protein
VLFRARSGCDHAPRHAITRRGIVSTAIATAIATAPIGATHRRGATDSSMRPAGDRLSFHIGRIGGVPDVREPAGGTLVLGAARASCSKTTMIVNTQVHDIR